jgi:lysophospholipase L1-like esterase
VTLLIGVNNQYRGRPVADYRAQFTQLMDTAITFANGRADRVFVLSIPDWGVTPFAADRDRAQIAQEIDAYNAANKEITAAYQSHYVAITDSTRQNGQDPTYLAGDGLHPSAKEYGVWAGRLADSIIKVLK